MPARKYRIWDKQKNEFFNIPNAFVMALGASDFRYALVTNQGLFKIPDTGQKDLGEDRWVVEESIGLQDRNKQDIYENDVIAGFGHLFLVKWGIARREMAGVGGSVPYEVDIPSFYFERMGWSHPLYPIVNNVFGQHDLETLVIVGNVHQKPYLVGSIYRDKNDRTLFNGDIVRLSDEWVEKPRGHIMGHFGHVWQSDDGEWVLSYNHQGSECSDLLKDVPSEHMHYAGNTRENPTLMS